MRKIDNFLAAGRDSPHHVQGFLPLSRETEWCLVLMTNTKCIVYLSFSGSEAKSNRVSIIY